MKEIIIIGLVVIVGLMFAQWQLGPIEDEPTECARYNNRSISHIPIKCLKYYQIDK